jgi:hypothetical protein
MLIETFWTIIVFALPIAAWTMASPVIRSLKVKLPEKNVAVRFDSNDSSCPVGLEDSPKLVAAAIWTLEDINCGITVYTLRLDVMVLLHRLVLLLAAAYGKRRRGCVFVWITHR